MQEEARRARNRCFQSKKREETRNKIAQLELDVGSASAENRALRQKIAGMQARLLRAQPPYAQTSAPSSAAQSEAGTPPATPPRNPTLPDIPAASDAIDIPVAGRGTAVTAGGLFAQFGLDAGAFDLGLAAGVPGSLPAAAPQWRSALPAIVVDCSSSGSDDQATASSWPAAAMAKSWPPYLNAEQSAPLGLDYGSDFSSNEDVYPDGRSGLCHPAAAGGKDWLSPAIEMELTAADIAIDIGGLSPALDALSFDMGDVEPTPFLL